MKNLTSIICLISILGLLFIWRNLTFEDGDVCVRSDAEDKSITYGFFSSDGNCSVTEVMFFPVDERASIPIHRQVRDQLGARTYVGRIAATNYLDAWNVLHNYGMFGSVYTNKPDINEGVFLFKYAIGSGKSQYFLLPISQLASNRIFQKVTPTLNRLTNGVDWCVVTNERVRSSVSAYTKASILAP